MLKFDMTFVATMVVVCSLGSFTALAAFSLTRYGPPPRNTHVAHETATPVELWHSTSTSDYDQKGMDRLLGEIEKEAMNRETLMALFSATPEGQ